MTDKTQRDLPVPTWKVLKTEPSQDGSRTLYHVKLSQPHIVRQFADEQGKAISAFVEAEYVHVSSTHKEMSDKVGSFTYNETAITASDEDGNAYMGFLYFAHRALTLEESLFAIGEV